MGRGWKAFTYVLSVRNCSVVFFLVLWFTESFRYKKNHFSYNMRLNRLWMTVLCGSEKANVLLHASVENGLWPVSSINNEIILILGQQQDFLLSILVSWFRLSSWSSHFLNLRQCVLSNALAKIVVVMYSMRTVLLQVVYSKMYIPQHWNILPLNSFAFGIKSNSTLSCHAYIINCNPFLI